MEYRTRLHFTTHTVDDSLDSTMHTAYREGKEEVQTPLRLMTIGTGAKPIAEGPIPLSARRS